MMNHRAGGVLGGVVVLVLVSGCPSRQGDGVQRECVSDADCSNQQFCDGVERCVSGACVAGSPPCTAPQACDEESASCVPAACQSDEECSDGLFCNGAEVCGANGQCAAGSEPCPPGEVCDEAGDACVTGGTNVAPVALPQLATVEGGAPATLTLTGSDANGDELSFAVTTAPGHGTLSAPAPAGSAAATVTYTPDGGFTGTDTFGFTVSDGTFTTDAVVFTVIVHAGSRPLTVAFSTYLGGGGAETIRDVAVDREGNIYVVGGTASRDFPVTAGAYQTTFASGGTSVGSAGDHDAYAAKLDADGRLVWCTYVGGPNYDRAYAVEVDAAGYVYVGGRAGEGFPTTPGVVQPTFGGDVNPNRLYGAQDGFVAKLSPDGAQLVWATYFGGDDVSFFRDIDVDAAGRVHGILTRVSRGHPHITAGAFQTTPGGGDDGVVVRFSADGTRVEWATYLGGSGNDMQTPSIRVQGTGEVYVFGFTNSTDAPTTPGAFDTTFNGAQDEYLAKLSADGSRLLFGTYLGGSSGEFTETHGLMLDAEGNAYVTATTLSADFPVTAGAFQTVYAGTGGAGSGRGTNYPGDVFVAAISSDGTKLLAATYLGGSAGEGSEGIGLDAAGNVYVSGATYSADFPTTADALQRSLGGSADFFAVKLNSTLTSVMYSTFIGGGGVDYGRSSIADASGNHYVVGHTQSNNFPVVNAGQRNHRGGGDDGAVVKLAR